MNGQDDRCQVDGASVSKPLRGRMILPKRRRLLLIVAVGATLVMVENVSAMEDVVTGRWITRDPLNYNTHTVLPGGSLQDKNKRNLNHQDGAYPVATTSVCFKNQCRGVGYVSTQPLEFGYVDGMSLYQFLKSSPTLEFDPSGYSTPCGATDCGCATQNPSPVPTYADSNKARVILEAAYGPGAQGCVTLLIPYGIFCTFSTCSGVANATVNGHPILQHECCHACDFVDGGLCKYLAGWAADTCPTCPMNCENRPKSAHPTW